MNVAPIPARLRGILKSDGRCLAVALDHAMVHGPARGLENPDALIGQLIEAGADALVVSYGTLKRSGHLLRGRIPVIARIDGGPSVHTGIWREYDDWRRLFAVEDAAALGADAVVMMHFVGAPVENPRITPISTNEQSLYSRRLALFADRLRFSHPGRAAGARCVGRWAGGGARWR